MNSAARHLIGHLGLEPLPGEGGFFRPVWRGSSASTILFMITPGAFSAFHRLDRDEVWHFHSGDPVEHHQLDPGTGAARVTRLGPAVLAGDATQVAVPAGVWQGARLAGGTAGFALLGCTVAPPWEDRGFTLGRRDDLLAAFPAQAGAIRALTR